MATKAVLVADLSANTTRFEQGMKRASSGFKNFQDMATKATKAAAVGATGLGLALTALTIKQMGAIDAQVKLSRSLGVGLSSFQAISRVAEEAGVSQDQLATALTKTQKIVFSAANGAKAAEASFKRLGLSSKELINLTPDQQFDKVAKALSGVQNVTERTALATEIFGKQGRGIINMLEDYSAKADEARAFNDKFALSISEVDASKIEEANDTMGRVRDAFKGLGNVIAVQFSPLITAAGQAMLDAGVDGKSFGNAVRFGMEVASAAIDLVRLGIIGVRSAILAIDKMLISLALNVTYNLANIAKAMEKLPFMGEKARDLEQGFIALNEAAQSSGTAWKERRAALDQELAGFQSTFNKIEKIQAGAEARAKKNPARGISIPSEIEKTTVSKIDTALPKLDALQKKAEQAQDSQMQYARAIENSFSQMGDAFVQGGKLADQFKSIAINALRQVARAALSSLGNSLFGGGAASGGGFLSGILNAILPSFAVGSYNVPRDMTANIHKGEMIIPAAQAERLRSGGLGGGNVTVNIVNNSSAKVTQQQTQTAGGMDLMVMIDDAVAENIAKTGSRTRQSLESFSQRGLIRR